MVETEWERARRERKEAREAARKAQECTYEDVQRALEDARFWQRHLKDRQNKKKLRMARVLLELHARLEGLQ